MQVGKTLLIATSGDSHMPEQWAEVCAAQIGDLIVVDPVSNTDEARAARHAKPRVLMKIEDALLDTFKNIRTSERDLLQEHGIDRYTHSDDAEDEAPGLVNDAVQKVVAATLGSPFEAYFQKLDTQEYLQRMMGERLALVMQVERSHHASQIGAQKHFAEAIEAKQIAALAPTQDPGETVADPQ